MSGSPDGPDEPDAADDAALLAAHVAGDRDAFGTLVARHRDRLWAVALRTTGNPEDAADGLQDGLVAAYRRAAGYRGEAAVTTWLHRVVVNACLDRLRAARVRRTEPLEDDADGRAPGQDVARVPGRLTPATPEDPADRAVAAQTRARVLDALGRLSPEQRAALVLVDMEGYPVAEAALILGCAEGTVKSRCARGRARLAVLLGDLGPPAADEADGTVVGAGSGNPAPAPDVEPPHAPRGPPGPR